MPDSKASQEKTETGILEKLKERDLHPFLTYYAYNHMAGIYTKTIHHQRGSRKKFAEWTYPDLVGADFRIGEWDKDLLQFSKEMCSALVNLHSFEIKKELNISNLRESFFQTVSNSSWANNGYLVAANIDDNANFQSELERLSTSFGIGVIELDLSAPDKSEELYAPEYKEYLDWQTINKLFELNTDFKEFINRVTKDINIDEITKERYDKIFKKEELLSMICQ